MPSAADTSCLHQASVCTLPRLHQCIMVFLRMLNCLRHFPPLILNPLGSMVAASRAPPTTNTCSSWSAHEQECGGLPQHQRPSIQDSVEARGRGLQDDHHPRLWRLLPSGRPGRLLPGLHQEAAAAENGAAPHAACATGAASAVLMVLDSCWTAMHVSVTCRQCGPPAPSSHREADGGGDMYVYSTCQHASNKQQLLRGTLQVGLSADESLHP
jgi:hypothetical protein